MKKTPMLAVVITVALMTAFSTLLGAQEQSATAEKSATATQEARRAAILASIVPLKVTIVLSKYQGDKKVSSMPYELTVRTDNNKASLRMGTQVPVPGIGAPNPAADGKPAPRIGPFVMKDVGTNIDCTASNLDAGRFALTVTIEDSSIYEDSQRTDLANGSKVSGVSATRTFRTTNALVLRDGQSTEFTTAVDKVNGEMIKAAVTIAVVK